MRIPAVDHPLSVLYDCVFHTTTATVGICDIRTGQEEVAREPANNVDMKSTINPLKPTGHVMNQQFNIQQLYALPTLYLCVLYLSENKQRLVPLAA